MNFTFTKVYDVILLCEFFKAQIKNESTLPSPFSSLF